MSAAWATFGIGLLICVGWAAGLYLAIRAFIFLVAWFMAPDDEGNYH
jgi:hypothetical protein